MSCIIQVILLLPGAPSTTCKGSADSNFADHCTISIKSMSKTHVSVALPLVPSRQEIIVASEDNSLQECLSARVIIMSKGRRYNSQIEISISSGKGFSRIESV